MKPVLVLASASPRREALLRQVGIPFEVIVSAEQEVFPAIGIDHKQWVEKAAQQKARAVARRAGERIVLGADTVVVIKEVILGKPIDQDDARRMLQLLSNATHRVLTGLALIHGQRCLVSHEETEVTFCQLTTQEIEWYVRTGEPLDKAGAYGIQGRGAVLVKCIQGCYYNVVGLPLARLWEMLSEFGFRPGDEA